MNFWYENHIFFTVNPSLLQKRHDGPWFCVHVDCCRGEKCAQVRLVFTCVAHECCCFKSIEVGSVRKETIEFGGNLQLRKLWVVATSASVSEATWKTVTLWWLTGNYLTHTRETEIPNWRKIVEKISFFPFQTNTFEIQQVRALQNTHLRLFKRDICVK